MNLAEITKTSSLERLIQQMQDMVARINTVFGKEHDKDGYHAIPSFTDIVPSASMFIGTASQTFVVTVSATNPATLKFSKSPAGDLVTLKFEIIGVVGGTPAPAVSLKLPYGWIGKSLDRNTIVISDAGTRVTGQAVVTKDGTTVDFYRVDEANLTAGTSRFSGEVTFQVKNAR